MPSDFREEEERLLDEFTLVSGVSEISSTSGNGTGITSATGLQLLIDLDDTRLSVTRASIGRAVKGAAKQILRLMREFAGPQRLMRMTGEGGKVELFYFYRRYLVRRRGVRNGVGRRAHAFGEPFAHL